MPLSGSDLNTSLNRLSAAALSPSLMAVSARVILSLICSGVRGTNFVQEINNINNKKTTITGTAIFLINNLPPKQELFRLLKPLLGEFTSKNDPDFAYT